MAGDVDTIDVTNRLEKSTRALVDALEKHIDNGLSTLGFGVLGFDEQQIEADDRKANFDKS